MRLICSFALCVWTLSATAQTVSLELESHVPLADFGEVAGENPTGSDMWTFRDAHGQPYALCASNYGLAVFDLQDPRAPRRVGEVRNTNNGNSLWQDVKVYSYPDGRTYAFLITQAGGSGVQVIDLSGLPDSVGLATTFSGTSNAHNIFIHPAAKEPYAYVCVTNGGPNKGIHVLDISDPTAVTEVGYWPEFSAHDIYVYDRWADPAWDGKDVAIVWTEQSNISIVDVTDKTQPRTLTTMVYPNLSYSHSGWMDRTNRYAFAFDEADELGAGLNTTMRVIDLIDLENPGLAAIWRGPTRAIDHNGFVMGDYVYLANYSRGMTVLDVHDPLVPVEAAYYDTFPGTDDAIFVGAWAGVPFLGDGLLPVNDYNAGLFVLRTHFRNDPALTYTRYVPLNTDGLVGETRLRIINPTGTEARIDMVPVNAEGIGTMRAERRLAPGAMLYQPVHDLFFPAPAYYHWVEVRADQPVIVTVEGIGPEEAAAMPAADHGAARLIVPHIARDTTSFYTKASVVNVGTSAVAGSVEAGGSTYPLEAGGARSGETVDFETLFGGQITDTSAQVVARIDDTEAAALVGAELFGGKQVAQVAGLTLSDESHTTLIFAHLADVSAGWWTGIAVVNPDATQAAAITLSAMGPDGSELAHADKTLPPGGKLLDFVNDTNRGTLLIDDGIPVEAVWLKVVSDTPISGYELFSDSGLRLFAGLQAGTEPRAELVLPFGGNTDWYAGIAVVNPGNAAQNVTFTRYNADGAVSGNAVVSVAAGARFISNDEALFGNRVAGQTWLRATADGDGVVGFVLYGPFDSSSLCGLGAVPVSTP